MGRFNKVKLQVEAVEFLRLLKAERTYAELNRLTGLSITDLNRYVNGKVLPGTERAEKIIGELGKNLVIDEIKRRINRDESDYIDHSKVVFSTGILKRIPPVVGTLFEGRPNVVLTAAADGIPIATHIADFYDVDCAYAKKEKETGVRNFVESSSVMNSGRTVTYYLPEGSVDEGQKVFVVDDLMRTGHTQKILSNIAKKAGGNLLGIFSIFSFGDVSKKLEKELECQVESLIGLD